MANVPARRAVDDGIVTKWFSVLADRFGREIERMTVQLYLDAFDRASLTDRGLNAACQDVFDKSTFLPPPDVFINKAKAFELQFRREETPKLPTMPRDQQDAATTDDEYTRKAREARVWAREHPEVFRRLRVRIEAEHCARAHVANIENLSPIRLEVLKAALVAATLATKARGDETPESPEFTAGMTPVADIAAAVVESKADV